MIARQPPPKNITAEAAGWWRKIVAEYPMGDDALLLLQVGLEAFDRMRQAQKAIKKRGLTIDDRFGQPKANPATVIERDSRAAMLNALKALHLDIEPLHDKPGRPLRS